MNVSLEIEPMVTKEKMYEKRCDRTKHPIAPMCYT